jgi:hypothetical protein
MQLVYSVQVRLLSYVYGGCLYILRPRKDVPMSPPPQSPSNSYTFSSSVVPHVPPQLSSSSVHTNICTVGYCGLVDIGHRRLGGVTALGRVAQASRDAILGIHGSRKKPSDGNWQPCSYTADSLS